MLRFTRHAQGYGSRRFYSSQAKVPKLRLKWYPIPVWMGVGVLGWLQYRRISQREAKNSSENRDGVAIEGPWQVRVAAALPLRAMSRLWGEFNELQIPMTLRRPLFNLYAFIFGCNLDEIQVKDLKAYKNLNSFFYRELEAGARHVDENAPIVCPSDGRVMSIGQIVERKIGRVKGATYSLDALLEGSPREKALPHVESEAFGDINRVSYSLDKILSDPPKEHHSSRPGNSLYYAVIYLAPGDYHRFHSPTDWTVSTRRHVSGELFSVSPYMFRLLSSLFVVNERVVLLGQWKHGFFSMIPVGATNVGSIKINIDPELRTNLAHRDLEPAGEVSELSYASNSDEFVSSAAQLPNWDTEIRPNLSKSGYVAKRGQELGGFRLGSTVVLVFEAPSNFSFSIDEGQRVKFGQPLGQFE